MEYATKAWFELQFSNLENGYDGWAHQWRASQLLRIDLTFGVIKNYLSNKKGQYLDIGCGLCDLLKKAYKHNPNILYYGCDISENAINYNINHHPQFHCKQQALPLLTYTDNKFDWISATEVIYYLPEHQRTIAFTEIYRCLKTNGYFLFSAVINSDKRYFTENAVIKNIEQLFNIIVIRYNYAKPYTMIIEKYLLPIAIKHKNHHFQSSVRYFYKIFYPVFYLAGPFLKNLTLVKLSFKFSQIFLRNKGKSHIIVLCQKI